jgi:hypothetical protein
VILPQGYVLKEGESAISPVRMKVTPGYFEVMGLSALRGRTFDDRDSANAQRVVIVDERFANRFWPGQDAVGRRLYYPGAPPDEQMTVVGVIPSIRLENLAGTGIPMVCTTLHGPRQRRGRSPLSGAAMDKPFHHYGKRSRVFCQPSRSLTFGQCWNGRNSHSLHSAWLNPLFWCSQVLLCFWLQSASTVCSLFF